MSYRRITVTMTTTGSVAPGFEELRKDYRYGGSQPYVPSASERQKNPSAAATRAGEKAERLREFTEHRAAGAGVFEAGARVGVKQRAARRYEQQRLAATGEVRDA